MTRASILLQVRQLHGDMMACAAAVECNAQRIGRHAGARTRAEDALHLQQALQAFEWNFARTVSFEHDSVFPAVLDALPEAVDVLAGQRAEHREVETMIAALLVTVAEPPAAWRDERVRVAARDLVELLRIHLRKEETAIHRVIERVLAPEELALARQPSASRDSAASRRHEGTRRSSVGASPRAPDVRNS